MKNKPVTYTLIVAVIGIWAWIIYSVFGYMDGGDKVQIVQKTKKTNAVITDSVEQPAYILALNYKDPFLKKDYYSLKMQTSGSGNANTANAGVPARTRKVKEKTVLPPVQYLGRIGSTKATQKPVAILLINGKEYMLQETQSAEGITLAKINPDSVRVHYSNTYFYVRRNR